MDDSRFAVTLTRESDFNFSVDFGVDGVGPLTLDEPPPLGESAGPNASRVLAAAVAHCLSASLLFCLGKARVELGSVRTRVEGTTARNEKGRLRITHLAVRIEPDAAPEDIPRMQRCLELFEDFCIVTESVRGGIDVHVDVALPAAPSHTES
ncbi:MAG TPA: OsmC family protein [Longimicrobiales bacterium]|jgi:organic hydroperoxide reductase OsmC/OhrA